MRRIDAHVHSWKAGSEHPIWVRRKIGALQRDFMPAQLEEVCSPFGFTEALVVQAAPSLEETNTLLNLARDSTFIAGVIGWVDLEANTEALEQRLGTLRQLPKFIGIRAHPPREFDPAWLTDRTIQQAYRQVAAHGIAIDLAVSCTQLPTALGLIRAVPEMTVVINHCGRPFVMAGELEPWASDMRLIAREPNTVCKLSGLIERGGVEWSAGSLMPWIATVIEAFGPDRLIFASNWPVLTLMGTYSGWLEALTTALDAIGMQMAERDLLFGANAVRVYLRGLKPDRPGPEPP